MTMLCLVWLRKAVGSVLTIQLHESILMGDMLVELNTICGPDAVTLLLTMTVHHIVHSML